MSYEIIYDKKFIKTTRGVIPMLLSGSNNWFSVSCDARGRRIEVPERHWSIWSFGRKIENTPEEILALAEKSASLYDPKSEFAKFRSKWLLQKDVVSFYRTGIKTAQTLEEYLSANPFVSFNGKVCVYVDKNATESTDILKETLRTTKELEAWLDRATEAREELEKNLVCIALSFSPDKPLKTMSKVGGPVVAKGKHGYVTEYIKNKSTTYEKDKAKALVFPSVEDAMKELGPEFRFCKADTAVKPKPFVLCITDGYRSGSFIQKKTARHLFFSSASMKALHFITESAAKRYADSLTKSYPKLGSISVLRDSTIEEKGE